MDTTWALPASHPVGQRSRYFPLFPGSPAALPISRTRENPPALSRETPPPRPRTRIPAPRAAGGEGRGPAGGDARSSCLLALCGGVQSPICALPVLAKKSTAICDCVFPSRRGPTAAARQPPAAPARGGVDIPMGVGYNCCIEPLMCPPLMGSIASPPRARLNDSQRG